MKTSWEMYHLSCNKVFCYFRWPRTRWTKTFSNEQWFEFCFSIYSSSMPPFWLFIDYWVYTRTNITKKLAMDFKRQRCQPMDYNPGNKSLSPLGSLIFTICVCVGVAVVVVMVCRRHEPGPSIPYGFCRACLLRWLMECPIDQDTGTGDII